MVREKFVGILGGMGPDATLTFFQNILQTTVAQTDQEHLRILIYNNPKIPDRTAAILEHGEDPLPELIASARLLEQAGVDLITIPCVTVHYFYDRIQSAIHIPVLHIVKETLQYASTQQPECQIIGLLSTSGTLRSRLFQDSAGEYDVTILVPTEDILQRYIMKAIYNYVKAGVLSGEPTKLLQHAAEHLLQSGAQAIIAGCTEIPLALKPQHIAVPLLDPLHILAQAVIREAKV